MFKRTLPVLNNEDGVLTIFNGLQNLTRSNKSQCFIKLKVPGIKLMERAGDFYSKGGRIKNLSIEENNPDATTQLILKLATVRCEFYRHESNTLNFAVVQM